MTAAAPPGACPPADAGAPGRGPPGGGGAPGGDDRGARRAVAAAAVCAAVVLASQLAGKAARDAIFLRSFAVTNLPLLLAASSALAIVTTVLFARRLARGAPVRVVRIANLASAALLVIEWLAIDHAPRPVATLLYVHQTLLGPILVSGFWSLVGERFDPHTARSVVGAIGTGATVGGLLGAVLAERVAALAGTDALLPLLAALQLAAAGALGALRGAREAAPAAAPPAPAAIARRIAGVSLLRRLALITLIVTITAALIDYAFKAVVAAEVRPDDLARAFATFHGVVGLLTAAVQWAAARRALAAWGLARTLATLPAGVIAFGALAIAAPGVGAFAALRGAEHVLRSSLYRAAYEVLYTPLLAAERRATKTVIDVGVERLGDVLGGLAVLAILALAGPAVPVLLGGAIGLASAGVAVALRAQASYVEALERSLVARASDLELDRDEPRDRTTRATLELVAQRAGARSRGRAPLLRAQELASGDPSRVRAALAGPPLPPVAVAAAIPLLAQPALAPAVAGALAAAAPRCAGQLVDALRDPDLPLAARVALPRALAAAGGDLARAGLAAALGDPVREVRLAAAEALAELRERDPALAVDLDVVYDGVRRELAHAQAPAATQHVATLLALALPAEPIRTAFHGLWSDDPGLRGVALEYLDNVLPGDIRDALWLVLALEAPAVEKRPVEEVLAELLRTRRAAAAAAAP